tara:strand:+ start:2425 stop:3276 length:852 start_codon:yes stop_codon:yes gene_type:complete
MFNFKQFLIKSIKGANKEQIKNVKNTTGFLGRYPGRTLHRIGIFIGSLWASNLILNYFWIKPDQTASLQINYLNETPKVFTEEKSLQLLLVIEGYKSKGTNTKGNKTENIFLSLINLKKENPITIYQIRNDVIINLKDSANPYSVKEIYELGGLESTRDILRGIFKLKNDSPQRYLVLPEESLISMIKIDQKNKKIDPLIVEASDNIYYFTNKISSKRIKLKEDILKHDFLNKQNIIKYKTNLNDQELRFILNNIKRGVYINKFKFENKDLKSYNLENKSKIK